MFYDCMTEILLTRLDKHYTEEFRRHINLNNKKQLETERKGCVIYINAYYTKPFTLIYCHQWVNVPPPLKMKITHGYNNGNTSIEWKKVSIYNN